MFRVRALLVALVAPTACPVTAADPQGAPTSEQEARVADAVKALGGAYFPAGRGSYDSPVPVVNAGRLGDAQLKKLPPVPFPFRIVLGPKATDDGVKALRGFTTLAGVWLDGSAVTGAGVAELAVLPVEFLDIRVAPFSDRDLAKIGKFSALRALDLVRTAVTDAGLESLSGRGLKELTVPDRARTDRGLKSVLAARAAPTELDLAGWAITDASLNSLAAIGSLEALKLDRVPVTDAGVKALAGARGLRTLSLNGTRVTDAALPVLDGLPALRTLSLHDTRVTAAGGARLTGRKLEDLFLPDAAKTDEGLKNYLGAVTPRATLDLFLGWNLTDRGIEALVAGAPDLKRLNLGRCALTDAGAKRLGTLRALEWFDPFEAKGLTSDGVVALAALPELRVLNLNSATIDEAALKALGRCGKLEYLYLDRTAVADGGLKHLAGAATLRSLSLTNTAVGAAGLKALAGLPNLRVIHLWGCPNVTGAGLKALATTPNLQEVFLGGNSNMTEADLKAVRTALPRCRIAVTGDLRNK
jgi:hypothetical protein